MSLVYNEIGIQYPRPFLVFIYNLLPTNAPPLRPGITRFPYTRTLKYVRQRNMHARKRKFVLTTSSRNQPPTHAPRLEPASYRFT